MKKEHHPTHLYIDQQLYFLTAHTYLNQFRIEEKFKQLLINKIKKFFQDFNFKLYGWVVLDNHYHILFKFEKGDDLSRLMGKIHAGFSYEVNRIENKRGRRIWQNYWDWCIRSENDFWRHFNYIHHNPVKHGYVKQMGEYDYSSYRYWLDKKGSDWMASCFEQYPIIDFSVEMDEF